MAYNRAAWLKRIAGSLAALSTFVVAAGVTRAGCMTGRHDGTVLDTGGAMVTIKEKDSRVERMFRVSELASIRREGKLAKLADLKPGDSVRIVTETDARKVFATVVDAKAPRL